MRCFVALDLPDGVRAAVAAVQADLRAAARDADVRWVDPAAVHLTLKFLGAVPDRRVPEVSRALGEALADTPRLALTARGVGAFPTPARARVVWVGVSSAGRELAALAAAVDRALVPLGFPPEARPFTGHLTAGRVRSPRSARALAQAIEGAEAGQLGAWTASEVVLYESRLGPRGATYHPVSRHPLAGPDV